MFKNKEAFTLLEQIVVLLVVSTILFTFSIGFHNFNIKNELRQAAKIITTTYSLVREEALTNSIACSLRLTPTISATCDQENILVKEIDSRILVESNFNNNEIKINERGHIERGGTIMLSRDNQTQKITFGIGVGNYDIK